MFGLNSRLSPDCSTKFPVFVVALINLGNLSSSLNEKDVN